MHFVLQWFKPGIHYILLACLAREIKNLKGFKLIWNPSGSEREAHSQGIKRKFSVELNEFQNYRFPRFGNILGFVQLRFQEHKRAGMYSWQLSCLLFSSFLLWVPICLIPREGAALNYGFLSPKVLSGSGHIAQSSQLCRGFLGHEESIVLGGSS